MKNMVITERQKEILNRIVEEHINSAKPVSSQLIEKNCGFELCPATIRSEMQKLAEAGFIFQPHTSAGRIPTDKGYRFFVDDLLEKGFLRNDCEFQIENFVEEEMKDTIKLIQSITKNLALASCELSFAYLFNEKILWKEGWGEVLQEPEFEEKKLISDFAALVKNFEQSLEELEIDSGIKIYIGKENPFSKAKDFSIIISKCRFPKEEQGLLAVLGPKRMGYRKNINSLNSLMSFLEKF